MISRKFLGIILFVGITIFAMGERDYYNDLPPHAQKSLLKFELFLMAFLILLELE